MVREEHGVMVLTYETTPHETAGTRTSPEEAARLVKQLFAGRGLTARPI